MNQLQIAHFAYFLKNIYIKYCLINLNDYEYIDEEIIKEITPNMINLNIEYSDDDFIQKSRHFLEKISCTKTDKYKIYMNTKILNENKKVTNSTKPILREAINTIFLETNLLIKLKQQVYKNNDENCEEDCEDKYIDLEYLIIESVIKYLKENMSSLKFIKYLE